jgi:hypothetical protein
MVFFPAGSFRGKQWKSFFPGVFGSFRWFGVQEFKAGLSRYQKFSLYLLFRRRWRLLRKIVSAQAGKKVHGSHGKRPKHRNFRAPKIRMDNNGNPAFPVLSALFGGWVNRNFRPG